MEQSAGLRGADRTRHCLLVKPSRISPSSALKQHHPALFCSFQPRDGDAQLPTTQTRQIHISWRLCVIRDRRKTSHCTSTVSKRLLKVSF